MDTNAVPLNGVVPSLASIVMPCSSVPTATVAVSLGATVTVAVLSVSCSGSSVGSGVSSGTGVGHEVGLGGIIDDTFLVDL